MAISAQSKRTGFIGLQEQYSGQFTILWLIGMLTYMGMGLTWPQFSILITERGFSIQDYGIMQGIATFLSISTQVSIGKFSDRIGKRKPMVVGATLFLIPVVAFFPNVRSLWFFTALMALNQLASSLFNATTANWVTRFGVPNQMGRLHGFFRISFSVGWVISTMFMGKSIDYWGVNNTFYLAGGFLAASMLLAIIATRDVMSTAAVEKSGGATDEKSTFVWPAHLKKIFMALGIFTFAQTMGMNLNYIFIKDVMGVSNQQFGWLTSIQSWPEIPLMLLLGIVSDKISNTLLLSLGMILAGARWFLLSVVDRIPLLFAIQPLHAIGMTVTEVVIVAVISRQVPGEFLGRVMGWQVTVVSVARLLAPLCAGLVGEYFGIRTVFLSSALVAVTAAFVILHAARQSRGVKQGIVAS